MSILKTVKRLSREMGTRAERVIPNGRPRELPEADFSMAMILSSHTCKMCGGEIKGCYDTGDYAHCPHCGAYEEV